MFNFDIIDVEDWSLGFWLITFTDKSTTFIPKSNSILWKNFCEWAGIEQ